MIHKDVTFHKGLQATGECVKEQDKMEPHDASRRVRVQNVTSFYSVRFLLLASRAKQEK